MPENCNPDALAQAAKCFGCLPPITLLQVQSYLLCQILNNGSGGSGGTVTSFSAGNLVPLFATSVANPNTTPSLTFSLTVQNANTVLAGPAVGVAAAPSFRALVAADIPSLSAVYVPVGRTITINGTANQVISSAGAQDLSADRTWTLSLPQSIATTSTPQFSKLGLGIAASATIPLTLEFSTADFTNTGGANSHILMRNANAGGSTSVSFLINGAMCGKLRADFAGNLSHVAFAGGHYFFSGGDATVGTQLALLYNGGGGVLDVSLRYDIAGNPGVTGSFDATNTVTVTGGIITNIA